MNEASRLSRLSQYHEDIGDYAEAERLLCRALNLRQQQHGFNNLEVAQDFYNLGLLNLAMDDNDRAEKLLIRCLLIRRFNFDSDHPEVVETLDALALIDKERKSTARAN